MKKYITIITLILIIITSCQEVVDVDLETAQERLVIEAMIKWEKGTTGKNQEIKLSKTSSFYNNQILKAVGASVKVTNKTTLDSFIFTETQDGLYTTTSFLPIINTDYELEINFNGETYKATSTLFESPEIVAITQSTEDGFSTETPEVVLIFNDFQNQHDYYRVAFQHYRPSTDEDIDDFNISYDTRFVENNTISNFYESEDLLAGDEITVSIHKISEQFYNFITILEQQTNSGFGPFSTPPANVKGNCINTTNEDHYPYGYFGLNQMSKEFYIFE